MADSTVSEVSKMKVVDLRKELKSRGLPYTGDKAELVSRLQAAMQDEHADINLDSDEIDSDGVLEDEDDKSHDIVLDDSAVELALADNPPPKEPETKTLKTLKRKFNDAVKTENKEGGGKKIVLNRALSITTATDPPKEPKPDEAKTPITAPDSDKVKVSAEIDPKLRLELRAKRFGLPVNMSDNARKEARKLRFGQAVTGPISGTVSVSTGGTSASLSENLEKLKKRAERFGQSVSKIMTEIESKEKLEKRKEKFGTVK